MIDTFPYVQDCPDCGGWGWKPHYDDEEEVTSWGGEIIRTHTHPRSMRCKTCCGRGKIIPPEWTEG